MLYSQGEDVIKIYFVPNIHFLFSSQAGDEDFLVVTFPLTPHPTCEATSKEMREEKP
jgi:hypothetical protein